MRFRLFLFSFLSLALLFTPSAQASIGVGVGTGRIQLEEELKPGILYQLPSISVINTGDEAGEYILDVSFRENQSEMRPNVDWFTYKPEKFSLEPGEGKIVEVTLTLPVKTVPGDYFAFLEARPIATSNNLLPVNYISPLLQPTPGRDFIIVRCHFGTNTNQFLKSLPAHFLF